METDAIDPRYMEDIENILEPWTDYRLFHKDELAALALYLIYGENVLSQLGGSWDGCTIRQRDTQCLLVTKATFDGLPYVAFCSDRTPSRCVRSFVKQLSAGTVKWSRDKYR